MKKLIKESGLRDINALAKRYPKAEIYFHQDLDGVTTAIAMKEYLKNNGIDVIDAHIIQYGDKEFAVKKNDAKGDVMPVLVDFAHGKPMFVIHTDHHDRQAGAEDTKSTSFRSSRSNVETISQVVSPKELFPSSDILLISTVDSANYAVNDISVDQVISYLFRLDKEKSLEKNKEDYVTSMQTNPNVKVLGNVIVQYGGGSMFKPGSYDRYTPFKNNPEADFIVIAWPLGLVQASCNPFKGERQLKGVNLGEIAQEVLSKWEDQLKQREITLSTIKWISESSKDFNSESTGFTFKDFVALYGKEYKTMEDGREKLYHIGEMMEMPFSELPEEHRKMLDDIKVNAWDFIQANSGGHKCITNISGLNFMGRSTRPPKGSYRYNEAEESPSVKFTKMIQNEFVKVLQEKINQS